MIFAIKRASDSLNTCALWQSPCQNARAIPVLVQVRHFHPWRYETCPQPLQIHVIELDSLDDLAALVREAGEIIVYESPYEATPGDAARVEDRPSYWPEPVRGLDGEPLDILSDAHGIIIYDNYME